MVALGEENVDDRDRFEAYLACLNDKVVTPVQVRRAMGLWERAKRQTPCVRAPTAGLNEEGDYYFDWKYADMPGLTLSVTFDREGMVDWFFQDKCNSLLRGTDDDFPCEQVPGEVYTYLRIFTYPRDKSLGGAVMESSIEFYLKGLGGTPDEIAESLRKVGLKGKQYSPRFNIISNALRQQQEHWGGLRIHEGTDGSYYATWGDPQTMDPALPKPIQEFLHGFDEGKYPHITAQRVRTVTILVWE